MGGYQAANFSKPYIAPLTILVQIVPLFISSLAVSTYIASSGQTEGAVRKRKALVNNRGVKIIDKVNKYLEALFAVSIYVFKFVYSIIICNGKKL
jgi:tmRNA-binding protein